MNHVEHIGIAVKDLTVSKSLFEKLLNTSCYKTERVESEGVETAFFQIGETKIELLESIQSDGVIAKFIERKGEGIHHIAFAVPSVAEALAEVEAKGVKLIDKAPRGGAEGLNIAFLHPKSTCSVLTELCEHPEK